MTKVVWLCLLYARFPNETPVVVVEVATQADCMRVAAMHKTATNAQTGCIQVRRPVR